MKSILSTALVAMLCQNAMGQFESADSVYYFDTAGYNYRPGFFDANFFQLHTYGGTAAELYSVDKDYFNQLIEDDSIPSVELDPAGYLVWIGLMREQFFYNISFSFSDTQRKTIDSLAITSRLRQNSLAVKTGYNLVSKNRVVVSPYLGLRIFRFKHLTESTKSRAHIDDYLNRPNIDLRITQLSAVGGLNTTFSYKDFISFGFYVEYVQNLHKNPIVRTKGSRLSSDLTSPVNNLLLGIGMGIFPMRK